MLEPTVSDQGRRISCESHGFYSVKKKKKRKKKEKKKKESQSCSCLLTGWC